MDRRIAALIIIPILITLVYILVYLYTEYLWFISVGYAEVFLKMLEFRLAMFSIAFTITMVISTLNAFAIKKAIEEFMGEPIKYYHSIDIIFSLITAYLTSDEWVKLLFYLYGVKFGIRDPIFGYDVSFYVFKLPFIELLIYVFAASLVYSLIMAVIYYAYAFRWVKSFEEFKEIFPVRGYYHISILSASMLITAAVYFYVARYNLLSAQHDVVSGAGWTDVHVVMPAMLFMSALSLLLAAACVYYGRNRLESLGVILLVFVASLIVSLGLFPFFVQKFKVEPNELKMEWKYIGYSINFTRYAYGLEKVEFRRYVVSNNLTLKKLEMYRGTIENIRLWDHRPIKEVFKQIQQIRPYYVIKDVDVDRYHINGKYTEVMIAARELSIDQLPSSAQTWMNIHLIYTHGYGVVMAPVNVVSQEGLPDLIVKDIPPNGSVKISQPRIYFGELTNYYVIVDTLQKEFDYPLGQKNVFTRYRGKAGVPLNSYFRKVLFSMRFGDVNIVLSKYITNRSRILFHRNIEDRVRTIAPFLKYDSDPYIAVINGRLYWIIDAYTTLDDFPYSAKYYTPLGEINYIRNPVKVFIDAYNGTVEFYMIQKEPVIETFQRVFHMFRTRMDREKRMHIRYPKTLFEIQAEVYSVYHMVNVETFYNREDVWAIPYEMYEGNKIKMEPYYVMLSIEDKPEFVLMLPFTPRDRENLIAWMCARCDGRHYGQLIIYEFPKGKLVFGPMQVEARIDQNPNISKLFTLWGQVGSRVIRGNLLVIPIAGSIIYVEPVYLKAEESQIPELRGVIVAYDDKLVMRSNLQEALKALFKQNRSVRIVENPKGIVKECIYVYNRALYEVRRGNWTGFGEMLKKLGELLKRLNETLKSS